GGVLLVEGEVRRDQSQDAAGSKGVDGLGEEVIVQRELPAVVVELQVGEWDVPDHRVDAVLWQPGFLETFDADGMARMQPSGNPAGYRVQLDADEVLARPAMADEVADAAAWLQNRGVAVDA